MTADEPAEAWDGVSDFYEEDEPAEDIKAAWEQGEHVVTAAPPSPSVPVESREQPSGHDVCVCAASVCPHHIAVLAERDATIRELREHLQRALDTAVSNSRSATDYRIGRDRARDLAAHLRGEVEAALAFQDDKRGVSCAGYSVDDDGCFVADLAARIRTAIATHDVQAAITGAHLAAHLEAEQAEED